MLYELNQLEKLKEKARRLYVNADLHDDLDCGRQLQEVIRPEIGSARCKFDKVWLEIQKLDPSAPPNPFI